MNVYYMVQPSPVTESRTRIELVDFGSRKTLFGTCFRGDATTSRSPSKLSTAGGRLTTLVALLQAMVVVVLVLGPVVSPAENMNGLSATGGVFLDHNNYTQLKYV